MTPFEQETSMVNSIHVPGGQKRLVFLLLASILAACASPTASTPSPLALQPAGHILVSITEPATGEAYPVSAGLSIRAEAISDSPITHMELWADGEMVETYTSPDERLSLLIHSWTWSPGSLGTHTLVARAYNDQGQAVFSNVLKIDGIEDPGYILITQAEEGDTPASISERYHISPEELALDNPGLSGTAALTAGETVIVHIRPPEAASTPSIHARILMKMNTWPASGQQMITGSASGSAAPGLSILQQGCNALLDIADQSTDEGGFHIYRLKPGSLLFSQLATLPAHEGVGPVYHTDPGLYGLYHYYVSSFNGSGETAGNLVSIQI
ncbi:MAG: LysM peptidoglycan-binding domain-containing protein, partial [Chloroflexi bacterium]|nr:LysM peptidoglycan-binding domain-containing protein [Chloroflexota bacterium]